MCLTEIGPVVSEEKAFEKVDKRQTCDHWQRSLNDLDLQNFVAVELQCIFKSESTIATEIYTF